MRVLFSLAVEFVTGRTAGAVFIFWFVLHQGKMNEGKPLQKVRQ